MVVLDVFELNAVRVGGCWKIFDFVRVVYSWQIDMYRKELRSLIAAQYCSRRWCEGRASNS